MRVKTLENTINEAKRFIEKAEHALICETKYGKDDAKYFETPSHMLAAAKRASMDLTRQLAVFRRGEP